MKSVILYYTFGGSTKKEAERLASELGAPLHRVMEKHNRSFLGSFIPGGLQAMRHTKVPIKPLGIDLTGYDRIIIGCPVWAGNPAPVFNTLVELLPAGKEVELFFCSGSGDKLKDEQTTRDMIGKKGCTIVSWRDIQTKVPPSKMKE